MLSTNFNKIHRFKIYRAVISKFNSLPYLQRTGCNLYFFKCTMPSFFHSVHVYHIQLSWSFFLLQIHSHFVKEVAQSVKKIGVVLVSPMWNLTLPLSNDDCFKYQDPIWVSHQPQRLCLPSFWICAGSHPQRTPLQQRMLEMEASQNIQQKVAPPYSTAKLELSFPL